MDAIKKTPCGECGKQIKYATRKPKICTVCRAKTKRAKGPARKKIIRKKRPENKNTQGELILFKVLEEVLAGHEFINHGYYSFLPSPKGYPLQLDRYYPGLKLGWEFDGKQHEEYNKYIHRSQKNFEYYQECDRLKEKYCKQEGITLIRVAWNDKITVESIKLSIEAKSKSLFGKLF